MIVERDVRYAPEMRDALELEPFGSRALRIVLGPGWAEDLGGRAALSQALLELDDVRDALVTETHALVMLGAPVRSSHARATLAAAVARCAGAALPPGQQIEVEVVYDGADLEVVARSLGVTASEVIARHTERDLHVSFLGFLPGFAYLRGLDPLLATLPRRATPRPRVPARTVAAAGGMSAIYPSASPGGWHLLGRAPSFDPLERELGVGDRLRFRSIVREQPTALLAGAVLAGRPGTGSESLDSVSVEHVAGISLVIDGAPTRLLHRGAPPGGPLVQSWAARANHAAGNATDAPLIERYGAITLALSRQSPRSRVIADERGRALELDPGDSITLAWDRESRVGYVAIEGGLAVPLVLGGCGTILSIGRGGHEGRPLRAGDRLRLGGSHAGPEPEEPREEGPTLAMTPGPELLDLDHARDVLASATFRIAAASDRTGTRLVSEEPGALLSTRVAGTAPMRRGAVQAPPSGELVVLGPDHPVTGGYPVVGFLDSSALDTLFARPIGARVRLRLTAEARDLTDP